jgi:FkbM family methyltransferase
MLRWTMPLPRLLGRLFGGGDTSAAAALSLPHPEPNWNRCYGSEGLDEGSARRAARFDRLERPFVLRWSDGLLFRIVPREQISRALYVSGTYEPNALVVLRSLLRDGDVFVDVGANAGVFSLVGSRWVGTTGRVLAFEPSSREFSRLGDTIALNGLGNVQAVRAAVGSEAGTASLRVAVETYAGLNTLGRDFAYDGIETAQLERVSVTTLDAFVTSHGVSRVAAMKIDVEGAERDVLLGAREVIARDRPALIVEVLAPALESTGTSVADLEALLRRYEYRLHAIADDTAALTVVEHLTGCSGENIVALPAEGGAGRGQDT